MEAVVQNFKLNLNYLCSLLSTAQGRALTKLISLGIFDGPNAWKLFIDYKSWGLLHLLILSGSQFYSFAKGWELTISAVQKIIFGSSRPWIAKCTLIPAAIIFLTTLGFSAPLVRCALIWAASSFVAPDLRKSTWLICLVFIVHLILIEKFSLSNSAFLSWLAFLMLMFANSFFKNYFARTLFVTLVLQLSIFLIRGIDLNIRDFLVAGACNLVAIPLFERCLFPLVGLVSALTLLLSVSFLQPVSTCIFKAFFAPLSALLLDFMVVPLLVAHNAFRYTFSK